MAMLEEEDQEAKIMDVDLISKLPDPNLSFIPAVRTSLLSRRWRLMCYSVPTLEFYACSP